MSTIKVSCIDQALAFENTPLITSGGLDENFVTFTFCGKWDGFEKTAVFWRNEADAYHVRLDSENTCQIPPEVTTDEGTIFFGVFGVNTDSKQRTSAVLTYRVEKGVITLGTAPSDPTPDIYTQFLAEVGISKGLVQETRDAEAAFETKMASNQSMFMQQTSINQSAFMDAVMLEFLAYKDEIAEAAAAGLVPDGTITTARLANGAVTAEKLNESAFAAIEARGVRFTAGEYTGTGTYGSQNKNTLTGFPFVPAVVIIVADDNSMDVGGNLFLYGQSKSSNFGLGNVSIPAKLNLTWTASSVSWYTGSTDTEVVASPAELQLNASGVRYRYIAIGK